MSLLSELKRRNVIRVAVAYVVGAWLLIQVVETILPAFGFGDAAVRIVTIACAIGLLPVLILAWTFELTPEGIKKDSDVDRSQPASLRSGKTLDRIIMIALAIAVVYFAVDEFVIDPERKAIAEQQQAAELERTARESREQGRSEALVESYGDKSIAVLAFDDMSSDMDQEYLSDGISEELLNLLAKIPELRVISRSSAFSYKGQNIKLPQVAMELKVAHILEGSVRKVGDQVRITAQLIEARSDTHLWSETYDRTLDDIFAVQDEIAANVAERLKVTLLGKESKQRQVDPRAYELLLESRHVRRAGTPEAYHRSNELADQALEVEPDFARPWVVKAKNYANMAESGVLGRQEGYRLAQEAADAALAINPDQAGAHSAFAWVAMYYHNDRVLAARHFEIAQQLNPGDLGVLSNSAALLLALHRFDQAIAVQEYVTSRDPVNAFGHFNLGEMYFGARRFDDSAESFRTMLKLSPDIRGGQLWLSKALLKGGDAASACNEARREAFEPFRRLALALCLYGMGDLDAADENLNWIMEKGEEHFPYDIASVWAYRENGDETANWVQKAIAYDDNDIGTPAMDPLFEFVLNDPRWLNLMKALGKSRSQLDSIVFQVTPPTAD